MNSTLALLQSHRSIRKFADKPIPADVLEQLILSGQAAATSSFVQSVSVIRVSNPELRLALAEIAGGQQYIVSCAEFLVICADMHRNQSLSRKHGVDPHTGFTEHFIIASVDTGLFAQNLVVAAESSGLGICYIGALRNNPAQVSELLKIPDLVVPMFGLCLGYPAQDPEVKPRMPISMMMHENNYSSEIDCDTLSSYDDVVEQYYKTRTGSPKSQGWSEQMSRFFSREARPHMMEFLRSKGFLLK